MPAWIHERAEHLLAKNPAMPKAQAFAIATLQSHSLGKSPEAFGTSEGRERARATYSTPKDDKKTANPGGLHSAKLAAAFHDAFAEELLEKWAALTAAEQAAYAAARERHASWDQQAGKGTTDQLNKQMRHSAERLKHFRKKAKGEIDSLPDWVVNHTVDVPEDVLDPSKKNPFRGSDRGGPDSTPWWRRGSTEERQDPWSPKPKSPGAAPPNPSAGYGRSSPPRPSAWGAPYPEPPKRSWEDTYNWKPPSASGHGSPPPKSSYDPHHWEETWRKTDEAHASARKARQAARDASQAARDASQAARDAGTAALNQKWDAISAKRRRSSNRGAAMGAAFLTAALLAPAAIHYFQNSKQKKKKKKPTAGQGWTPMHKAAECGFDKGFGEALLKLAFATSEYSAPLNPVIQSGASTLPPFKQPQLRAALQKSAEGAPTRGNFMMASDVPAFKPPNLRTGIQKDADMLPDGVTYSASDFKPVKFNKHAGAPLSPAGRLAHSKAVGMPKMTAPSGPSIVEIAKPKGPGFGSGISGAYKGVIGGTGGTAQK